MNNNDNICNSQECYNNLFSNTKNETVHFVRMISLILKI